MQKQPINQALGSFVTQPARGSGAGVVTGMARTAAAAVLTNSPASRMFGKAEKPGRK